MVSRLLIATVWLCIPALLKAEPPDTFKYVGSDCLGFVHIELQEIIKSKPVQMILKIDGRRGQKLEVYDAQFGLGGSGCLRATGVLQSVEAILANERSAPEFFTVMKAVKPIDKAKAFASVKNRDTEDFFETSFEMNAYFPDQMTLIHGIKTILGPIKTGTYPLQKGKMEPFFEEAAKHHIFAAGDLSKLPEFATKRIPQPLSALTRAKSASIAIDIPGDILLKANIACGDEKDATALSEIAEALRSELVTFIRAEEEDQLKQTKGLAKPIIEELIAGLKRMKIEVQGKNLRMSTTLKSNFFTEEYAEKVVNFVVERASEIQEQNNLKMISLAMLNYESAYGTYPANGFSSKQKPLLSWRVTILPYLEGGNLYNEFHLDEPWDSEHNKNLIPRMPKIFLLPGQKNEGKTHYRVFQQNGSMFENDKGSTIASITDGTSNTMLVCPIKEAVEWTKPDELIFDPKGEVKKQLYFRDGKINACFADASIRKFSDKIKETTLKALITKNGGEVLPEDLDK